MPAVIAAAAADTAIAIEATKAEMEFRRTSAQLHRL
jgi:hypothetical protein